jgi:lipopolysaccharide heptosyltransferase II
MMKIDKEKVSSILFITLSNLGDIILTTPVLEKLCDEFPGATIDVVTGPAGREIFAAHPAVKNVIVYEKRASFEKMLQFILDLRSRRYDLTVDLKNSLAPYLIGTRFRTNMFKGGVKSLFKSRGNIPVHKKEEHLSRLAGLGIDVSRNVRFFVPTSDEDRYFADKIIPSGNHSEKVVINPGAKSHLKRWDAGKFAGLSDRLITELGCEVFICGNEDDRQTVQRVKSSITKPVTDLCCKTTVGSLYELMKKADLVITGDSAPLHLASASGAPTIAVFGPSDERKYGPLADKSRVIKPDVPCRPCEKALCAIGPDEGCISRITVDEVFEASKKILKKG